MTERVRDGRSRTRGLRGAARVFSSSKRVIDGWTWASRLPGVPAAAPARVRVQRETEVSDIKSVQGPVAKVLDVIKCDETALQAASRAFAISCSAKLDLCSDHSEMSRSSSVSRRPQQQLTCPAVIVLFNSASFTYTFKPRQTEKRAQALGHKSLLYGKVEGKRELARIKPYIFSRDATSRLLTVGTCLASPARAVFTGCPGPAWRRPP